MNTLIHIISNLTILVVCVFGYISYEASHSLIQTVLAMSVSYIVMNVVCFVLTMAAGFIAILSGK